VLLAQARIPSLDEAIAAVMQEESRMKSHSEAKEDVGMRSILIVSNSDMTGVQGETQKCYNCGEVSHLSKACPKLPKERETCWRGQTGGRGRGSRRGGRGDYQANLTVAEGERETGVVFTEDDKMLFEILRRKHIAAGNGDKKSVTEEASTSSFP
jgi:Zinc knuckle